MINLFKNDKFYKANLHLHTTESDGKLTPEEAKNAYKAMGYSVIAYTDHEKFIPKNELTDSDFLVLNGTEISFFDRFERLSCSDPFYQTRKQHDMCIIAPSKITELPRLPYPASTRAYDKRHINAAVKFYRDAGFFVIHNHPTWSLETFEEYMSYESPNAIEIYNHAAFLDGAAERNENIFEDMLLGKKRVFAIATDDSHSIADAFGGWTVINARELSYQAITEALFEGSFYATSGPEIKELYVDDENIIHVKTSPAASIRFASSNRIRGFVANPDGTPVTEGIFKFTKAYDFFRIVVTDENGNQAFSNAYYSSDYLK